MTDPLNGQDNEGQGGYDGGQAQGNPAWSEFLNAIPQDLHETVTPILKKWDDGVNQRFNQVHSDWEPWKELRASGIDPDTAKFGVNIINALQTNPRMVYDALREQYKFDTTPTTSTESGQGQGEPNSEDLFNSRLQQLEEQNKRLAEIMLTERQNVSQKQLEAQMDTELDQELTALKTQHGNFDEQFVLARMMGGATGEQAVQQFFAWRDDLIKNHRPKPLLLGSGGGVPGGQYTDPKKLSPKDTRSLVVEMLNQANQQE